MEILEKIEPVKPARVSDEVFKFLTEAILTGDLKAGEKLPPERALAEKFSVHRNSVREALKKLEMMGLIEIRQGDGTFVNPIDQKANILLLEYIMSNPDLVTIKILKDLIRMRYVIETDAAFLAATNRDEQDLNILEEILYEEARHITEPISFVPLDFNFHRQILYASKNSIYQLLINSIKNTYTTFTSIFFSDPTVVTFVYETHCDLLEAIKNKNSTKAKDSMAKLLDHGEQKLLEKLTREGELK